jgi:hypothetical protein
LAAFSEEEAHTMGDGNSDTGDIQNSLYYDQWKKHSLLLYDTLINQKMVHPSPCVRWGRVISEDQHNTVQRYGLHECIFSLVIQDKSPFS